MKLRKMKSYVFLTVVVSLLAADASAQNRNNAVFSRVCFDALARYDDSRVQKWYYGLKNKNGNFKNYFNNEFVFATVDILDQIYDSNGMFVISGRIRVKGVISGNLEVGKIYDLNEFDRSTLHVNPIEDYLHQTPALRYGNRWLYEAENRYFIGYFKDKKLVTIVQHLCAGDADRRLNRIR
jgi:hypothetical protein